VRAFQDADVKRVAAQKRKENNANNFTETYKAFVKFVRTSDAWKAIARHVVVADDRDETSWVTNGLVDGTFNIFFNFLIF
jgi:hypothetical protein